MILLQNVDIIFKISFLIIVITDKNIHYHLFLGFIGIRSKVKNVKDQNGEYKNVEIKMSNDCI
jgi:hypothetical protein